MPPVEVRETEPSAQDAQVAVPLRVPVETEAGLALGAPAGVNTEVGKGLLATVTVKAPLWN
jgi:hypothetical protein